MNVRPITSAHSGKKLAALDRLFQLSEFSIAEAKIKNRHGKQVTTMRFKPSSVNPIGVVMTHISDSASTLITMHKANQKGKITKTQIWNFELANEGVREKANQAINHLWKLLGQHVRSGERIKYQ